MTGDFDFAAAARIIRADKCVTLRTGVQEGWLSANVTAARDALMTEGYAIVQISAGLTANSRQRTTVEAVCRDEHVARLPWHTQVQLLGLAAARRQLRVPVGCGWVPQAEQHVRYDHVTKKYVAMTVPDGVWDEVRTDGNIRSWLLEYSHGEFERRRLREKVERYGPNPQLWVTPSAAHGKVVESLLDEIYPDVPSRVLTVNWTGGSQ